METAKLTKAMIEENKKLEMKDDWDVVSYIGTDVMGDSRYLMAVPLLAALGFKVPSIQGNTTIIMLCELEHFDSAPMSYHVS